MPLPISFLSDYGYSDEFAGVCRAVIHRLAPDATVIDVGHGLPRGEVLPAAAVARNVLPFLPAGVILAVVDPGVGSARRALALRCGDQLLVGPDNGLLWPAAERLGGVEAAVEVTHSPWRLEPVSATFHGRDLFAPVAARLALGSPLEEAGEPLAADQLVRLELPIAEASPGELTAVVVYVDRFGNAQLAAGRDDVATARFGPGDRLEVEASNGGWRGATSARTFADAPRGELLVYEDSYGAPALAVNGGDAAAALGLRPGSIVRVRAAGS